MILTIDDGDGGADVSTQETECKIVAHVISSDPEGKGYRARLVLKDDEGSYRAVLGVGEWQSDFYTAVEDVVRKFETKWKGLTQ